MNLINSTYKISGALESLPGGREENQDFMGFADTQLGFVLVLCDGMGGGPGGLTASTTVVDAVIHHLSSFTKNNDIKTAIRQSIAYADDKIARLITASPTLTGMGTTVVVLVINNKSAFVAHIGDSRLYQFRFGYKVFRTNDHSQVGELVRSGALTEEQARISPNSNVVTRAINGCGIAQPDIIELPYEKGDRFVLCSDGIWGSMPEKELIRGLTKTKSVSGTVVQMAFDVDEIGKAAGGKHDNLSIAIVETQTNSKLKVKMGKKIRIILFSLLVLLSISIIANLWALNTTKSSFSSNLANSNVDSLEEIVSALAKDTSYLREELKSTRQIAKQFDSSKGEEAITKDLIIDSLKRINKRQEEELNKYREQDQSLKSQAKPKLELNVDQAIEQAKSQINRHIQTISNTNKHISAGDIQSIITLLKPFESDSQKGRKIKAAKQCLEIANNNAKPSTKETQKAQLITALNKLQ